MPLHKKRHTTLSLRYESEILSLRPEYITELWQWRDTLLSPDIQSWSLTLRCSPETYPGYPFYVRRYSQRILSFAKRAVKYLSLQVVILKRGKILLIWFRILLSLAFNWNNTFKGRLDWSNQLSNQNEEKRLWVVPCMSPVILGYSYQLVSYCLSRG